MVPELFPFSLFTATRLDSKAQGRVVSSRTLGAMDDKSTYAEGVTQIGGRCHWSNAFSVSESLCFCYLGCAAALATLGFGM